MKRAHVLAGMAAALLLSACGEEAKFSEKKVYTATKVEDGQVKGDPFCSVDSVLTDADAITKQRKKDPAGIITSKAGHVGLVVEPPFPTTARRRSWMGSTSSTRWRRSRRSRAGYPGAPAAATVRRVLREHRAGPSDLANCPALHGHSPGRAGQPARTCRVRLLH